MKDKYNVSDYINKRFGRLIIINQAETINRIKMVNCLCDCGNVIKSQFYGVINGHTKSCGCYRNEKPLKGFNEVIVHENFIEVVIDSKKYGQVSTIVDIDVIDKMKQYTRWYLSSKGYVCTTLPNRKNVFLHSLVLGETASFIDHINGNNLDNRRLNLRKATCLQNSRNKKVVSNSSSGCNGVSICGSKWRSAIYVNKKHISLGCYTNIDDAIKARHQAEIKYFGEFAPCLCRANQGGDALVN